MTIVIKKKNNTKKNGTESNITCEVAVIHFYPNFAPKSCEPSLNMSLSHRMSDCSYHSREPEPIPYTVQQILESPSTSTDGAL